MSVQCPGDLDKGGDTKDAYSSDSGTDEDLKFKKTMVDSNYEF